MDKCWVVVVSELAHSSTALSFTPHHPASLWQPLQSSRQLLASRLGQDARHLATRPGHLRAGQQAQQQLRQQQKQQLQQQQQQQLQQQQQQQAAAAEKSTMEWSDIVRDWRLYLMLFGLFGTAGLINM